MFGRKTTTVAPAPMPTITWEPMPIPGITEPDALTLLAQTNVPRATGHGVWDLADLHPSDRRTAYAEDRAKGVLTW